jgi:CRP/FNR family cyclic AMP-dependent transcriptional regulator
MAKKLDRMTEYVNILRQTDIFYDLTESQLNKVATLCSESMPRSGEIIFEENSTGAELYVVATGEIDILVNPDLVQSVPAGHSPSSPRPLTIATIRRGQSFGEIALVDQGLRSASARCETHKTRLLVIPRDKLIQLCDADTDLGYRLMRNIAADLAFKIRGTDLAIREKLLWNPRS